VPPDEQRRRTPAAAGAADRRSDVLALGSFVVLGLPDGILGTAWPSMRVTFGAPVSALGLVLLLATAGSVLVTAFVGTLIQRLGVPALLAVAGSCAALGAAGYALAPGFGLVLGAAVLGGAAAGGAGVSALIGLLIGTTSLAVLGPSLTTLAILVVAAELILTRLAPITR